MERARGEIRKTVIPAAGGEYLLLLEREDFSGTYPGMARYSLSVTKDGETVALFRTNSYEYTPSDPLDAETAALRKADAWEHALRTDPGTFAAAHRVPERRTPPPLETDVLVIQGSPRGDGNCAILAGWAAEAARDLGKKADVIFPHDMEIHHCIGCYQCYNTGSCVFNDDMASIIHAIRHAALVVVCTPVYTNTVPGGLKLLFDRCQAYHAERTITGGGPAPKGLLLSVAGRPGLSNFACITGVTGPFMRNIGIVPSGEVLVDAMDRHRDVRNIAGTEKRVKDLVSECLR